MIFRSEHEFVREFLKNRSGFCHLDFIFKIGGTLVSWTLFSMLVRDLLSLDLILSVNTGLWLAGDLGILTLFSRLVREYTFPSL